MIRNWIDHLGFSYHQIHASGHAPMQEVGGLIERIRAKRVVPIHTEHPELFQEFKRRSPWRLEAPTKGKPVTVPSH